VKTNFSDWQTSALRMLVVYLSEQLVEYDALYDHIEGQNRHFGDPEVCRVTVIREHLRRLHWAACNALYERKPTKEPKT